MATPAPMRILIVEDEPVSRQALRTRLEREPGVDVVGEAADGASAVQAILALKPDVVFLDIQIPPPDGFGVLEAVAEEHLPAVVFVTAFDQFAIQAFEVHALDYLLKPVDQQRVQRALARARRAVADDADSAHNRLADLLAAPAPGRPQPMQRLVVRRGERYHLVVVDRIDWLEAEGNYVRIHVGQSTDLIRSTLRELEAALDPLQFARIHRGIIVNISRVASISPSTHGDGRVILTTGSRLRMSRSYRANLLPS